jgi:1-acyl-sn-glycerol-3-phosphate acyltransferase
MDKINPIFKFEKNGKPKVLNIYGLYHLFVIVITIPFWMASMEVLHWLGNNIQGFDEDRAKFDYAGKLWCRAYLTLTDCYPQIEGDVSRLQDKVEPSSSSTTAENGPGACLFVANHASFLDIAVLCCVLDPVFKFIAKDSLMKFPGVGRQLVGVSGVHYAFVCFCKLRPSSSHHTKTGRTRTHRSYRQTISIAHI